jgi:hypothetical protein
MDETFRTEMIQGYAFDGPYPEPGRPSRFGALFGTT